MSLKDLSDAAAPGEWLYRPYRMDDWGLIRGGEIESEHIGLVNPPVATSKALWHDRDFDLHRAKGTDPMEANGKFIVALVNAYRSGQLVEVTPTERKE